jgi:hypothetical protein
LALSLSQSLDDPSLIIFNPASLVKQNLVSVAVHNI